MPLRNVLIVPITRLQVRSSNNQKEQNNGTMDYIAVEARGKISSTRGL
jgi:hypothetical protein